MGRSDGYSHFSAYSGDDRLLASLGLKTNAHGVGDGNGWLDLGTVEVYEAEEKETGTPRLLTFYPAVTVRVEVTSMPAQFWRFTVARNVETITYLSDDKREWRCDVAQEVYEVATGSGGFGEYWPAVRLLASNSFEVQRKSRRRVPRNGPKKVRA